MKTFLVTLSEKSQQRLDDHLLHDHVAHLKQLAAKEYLLICGPFVNDTGAMLVLQAASRLEIEALIQADPFIQKKYYADYSITEFYKADATNDYLMNHDQTIQELKR
jgi:uncharacterized protein YciI